MTLSLNSSQSYAYNHPSLLPTDTPKPAPLATERATGPQTSMAAGRQALKTALGDRSDLQNLAKMLDTVIAKLPEGAEPEDVAAALKQTLMPIATDSSFRREQQMTRQAVTLEGFINGIDFRMPVSVEDLKELARGLTEDSMSHPLGNYSGALSWSLPLSVADQQEVHDVIAHNSAGLEGLPLHSSRHGALDYLANALSLSAADLQNLVNILEKLLDSERSQALGEAIQRKLKGIATDTSVNDYVLAAIHLGLDPESIGQPAANSVAGFDLAVAKHFSKSAGEVVSALAEHLATSGRTSREMAKLGAHLLLARVAPQYLVKDIPAGAEVGSQAWANLCLAVARIEARTPGMAAQMSFNEVWQAVDGAPQASETVQKTVLMDWAVANQIIEERADGRYRDDEIETARTVFNQQQSDLKAASKLLATPMPDRKEMALAVLKKKFGDGIDFERKALRIQYGPEIRGSRFSDPYSMLDVTMQGLKLTEDWRVMGASTLDLHAFTRFTHSPEFNVPAAFDKAFADVTKTYKTIKQNLMMNAITHLPKADRGPLNYGNLRFFQEKSYKTSLVPFAPDRLFYTSPSIQVQTELDGNKRSYVFDTVKGSIKKVLSHPADRQPEQLSDEVTKLEEFFPDNAYYALKSSNTSSYAPNHFQNRRIQQVAATVVKGLEIDSGSVKRLAAGRTFAEERSDSLDAIGEFLLDLIPFRSATVNLQQGNYTNAATDFAFDVFGIVTAGLGAVGKFAKGAGKAHTALANAVRSTRIIGSTAFNAFNPLGGLGDVTVGAGKLAVQATHSAGSGIQKLRGMATASELADASKRFDSAATGTFKIGEKSVEGSAVMREGRWYAYDAPTQTAYGPARAFDPVHTLMPEPVAHLPQQNANAYSNRRLHPYKRTSQSLRPTQGTGASVTKTDHLDPVTGEYLNHIKGAPTEAHFTQSRRQATEARFHKEMNEFFEKMHPLDPTSRPPLPATKPYETVPDLIEKALASSDVVLFGESHLNLATFRALDNNIDVLKRNNVKVIGIEGVVYDNKGLLKDDGMGHTGAGLRPYNADLNLQTLIRKFTDNGIEVVPLDHFYLTRHRHDRSFYTRQGTGDRNLQRLKEFNYYAARELERHTHKGKVIALVGRQHINTTQGVTGLAEATGGIGIGVYERAGMKVGYGTNSVDPRPGPMGALTRHDDLTGDLQIFMPQ